MRLSSYSEKTIVDIEDNFHKKKTGIGKRSWFPLLSHVSVRALTEKMLSRRDSKSEKLRDVLLISACRECFRREELEERAIER